MAAHDGHVQPSPCVESTAFPLSTRAPFVRIVQLVSGRFTSGVWLTKEVPFAPVNVSWTIVIWALALVTLRLISHAVTIAAEMEARNSRSDVGLAVERPGASMSGQDRTTAAGEWQATSPSSNIAHKQVINA